jgi:hypothetical protein
MKTTNRAISISELYSTKHKVLEFTGEWKAAIGKPELTGSMLIYGVRKNGKTRFALQLCKYLTNFCKVIYDSLEEGNSSSFQRACKEVGFNSSERKFLILDKEPISELKERLKKRKSADVVVIDSVQYSGMKYSEYIDLINTFRKKLFIILSHAKGKTPRGSVAEAIQYDSFVVVMVEGYKAFAAGRYGGGEPFTIWHEGAANYWGE